MFIFAYMTHRQPQLLRGLKAVADPSRLRLLGLLSESQYAVSELSAILEQSQPRVSRHLRVLREAGLLERFRELHWVYYRMAPEGPGADLARALLELLDPSDPQLLQDRQRAAAVLAGREAGATTGAASEEERELAEVGRAEIGGCDFESLLYVGTEPTTMLRALAPLARRVLGLSESRAAVQRARIVLHGAGLAHCVLRQGSLESLGEDATAFDVVLVDRVLAATERPEQVLADALRWLGPGGRLVLVEDYEAMALRTSDGNPLAALREWISLGGLRCERIRPVDTGNSHLLVAIAEAGEGRAAA
ncbi:MAG TPA: metalloregulator ArsR/SmtB family transcription factor [Steroidobacteraceae bacterium]|nr:metalloregulator ArsR/SmtB family transcription factor [Steroidobacteraceae bacterium]